MNLPKNNYEKAKERKDLLKSNNNFSLLIKDYETENLNTLSEQTRNYELKILYLFADFVKWDEKFKRADTISWLNSDKFKKLSHSSQVTYIYRLKKFLNWLEYDTNYLERILKDLKYPEIGKFIDKFCIIGKNYIIFRDTLLNAINKYLKEKNLSQISSRKLIIYLKKFGVKRNTAHRSKGTMSYLGIDLSVEAKRKYGNSHLYEIYKKKEEIKKGGIVSTLEACVAGNFKPTIQLLEKFSHINEIAEMQDDIKKIISGICKALTLKCINRRIEVILYAALWIGLDLSTKEKINGLIKIDRDCLARLMRQILPSSFKQIKFIRSNKKHFRDFFINLAEKNNLLHN